MQQFWEFLAGLGLFLFAMHLMETSLKHVAGRAFKLFLRKHTHNRFEAIGSGAIVTGILQSSSVVIMTVLTFVGAGIITMRNALAVTIGSNFGTTLDSWLVATVGFKFEIDLIAMPLIGTACIVIAFVSEDKKIYHFARFLLGFGFLFLGLAFMKEGMAVVFEEVDFTRFENYPLIAFTGIGFVITALIQSSSATMAILLTALYTSGLPFEAAVAAVIGSELATTIKIVLGALKGVREKLQLAIGNVTFNVFICIVAFIFIQPLMKFTEVVAGSNPLLRLVAFQSSINLIGAFIFVPILNPFARLLEKHIKGSDDPSTFVIGEKLLSMPKVALDALEEDVQLLLHRVLRLNLESFASEKKVFHSQREFKITIQTRDKKLQTYERRYADLKKAEGEILGFGLNLIEAQPENSARIGELISTVRHAMHSAKAMKDVQHNRVEFHDSAVDAKFSQYIDFRKQMEEYYTRIDHDLDKQKYPELAGLINNALADYNERQDKIYDAAARKKLSPEDVSSLLNVSRELYTSCKTIVQALQLYHQSNSGKIIGDIP